MKQKPEQLISRAENVFTRDFLSACVVGSGTLTVGYAIYFITAKNDELRRKILSMQIGAGETRSWKKIAHGKIFTST